MKQAGVVVIFGMAVAGCASEPLWQPKDIPKRASEDVAPPPGPGTVSPPPREVEPPPEVAAPAPKPEAAPERKRAPLLAAGIRAYDDGKYAEAGKALRAALATRLDTADQLAAHKYLAFIECSTGRKNQCRDEFRKALRIDPSFELEPAEAGHPVWGPIFRGLKPKPKR
jgi:hypothetical protein